MIDFHIHSDVSGDCETSMKSMARSAAEKGLSEICFTEHLDLDFPGDEFDFTIDFNKYDRVFEEVKAAVSGISIYKGIEAGLDTRNGEEMARILSEMELDYVVGSQHLVYGYDPYYDEIWQRYSKEQIYGEYLRLCLESAEAFDFYDVFGHLGYIAKFCPFEDTMLRYGDYPKEIDAILKTIVRKGKGLEVNTVGLSTTPSTMPEERIVRRFYELGGKIITVGSDAHDESKIGYGIPETLDMLKKTGFEYVCAFERRKPKFIPIP